MVRQVTPVARYVSPVELDLLKPESRLGRGERDIPLHRGVHVFQKILFELVPVESDLAMLCLEITESYSVVGIPYRSGSGSGGEICRAECISVMLDVRSRILRAEL